jgi:hypothetical protein
MWGNNARTGVITALEKVFNIHGVSGRGIWFIPFSGSKWLVRDMAVAVFNPTR